MFRRVLRDAGVPARAERRLGREVWAGDEPEPIAPLASLDRGPRVRDLRGNGMDETDEARESALQERRREIVQRCLRSLMASDPQYFYQSTSVIAREIQALMRRPDVLDDDERDAVRALEVRDVEMLLAFR